MHNFENIPLKNRGAYILLGLFFGGFGLHNFYIGNHTRGVIQLLITLIGIPLSLLIGFIVWLLPIAVILLYSLWIIIEVIVTDTDAYNRKLI
jgi:TM2 domain-containing membrane protein YozV